MSSRYILPLFHRCFPIYRERIGRLHGFAGTANWSTVSTCAQQRVGHRAVLLKGNGKIFKNTSSCIQNSDKNRYCIQGNTVRSTRHLYSTLCGDPLLKVSGNCLPKYATGRTISFFGFGSSEQNAWQKAVSEAEKLVGYPTSFMSLRCLLSDELSNVAIQVRKLVGTRHPLLKTARTFVYDGRNNMQTRGLIVLLISKAAGPTSAASTADDGLQQSIVSGIYASQRALAEITEMIHTAYLVHKGVVNLRDLKPADGPEKDMEFGNKMAVLSGDFLLANASTGLAQLRNTKVVEIVSSAIRDMMEAEFTGYSNKRTEGLQRKMDISDWVEWAFLSSGSLIAKSCQAALNLANHSNEMQQHAFDYGKNMSLAQQLFTELSQFSSGSSTTPLNLNSVPVLLYLQSSDGTRNIEKYNTDGKIDFRQLQNDILSSDVIDQAKLLCHEYGQKALEALKPFPDNDARRALQNIVHAITRR